MPKCLCLYFCLNYSVAVSGSATENADYRSLTKNFLYNLGDPATKSFTISTIDDQRLEGQETITLTLSSINSHVTPGDIDVMTIIIIDNDGLYLYTIYAFKFHSKF